MGAWLISITLSSASIPSIFLHAPPLVFAPLSFAASVLYKISFIRLLFPLPDTPVTATNFPSGILTSIFLRLFSMLFLQSSILLKMLPSLFSSENLSSLILLLQLLFSFVSHPNVCGDFQVRLPFFQVLLLNR